jgi:hypothetical protein
MVSWLGSIALMTSKHTINLKKALSLQDRAFLQCAPGLEARAKLAHRLVITVLGLKCLSQLLTVAEPLAGDPE